MKIGKILLWILYAGFAAALVTGGVIRTQSRLDVVSSDRQGTGIGAGGEGQGQNQGRGSGDRQGTGIGAGGEGQGQNQGQGSGDRQGTGIGAGGEGQSQNQGEGRSDGGGQGSGGQGQGGGGQGSGNGQGGGGQGSGGQGQGQSGGQNDENYQYRDEDDTITAGDWLTESGEAVEVSTDLLLVDTGSAGDLLVEGRAWRFALEEGFAVQVGDALDVSGYWEDGEFKPGVIENQSTGETVTLRDPDGRPLWSGNRG